MCRRETRVGTVADIDFVSAVDTADSDHASCGFLGFPYVVTIRTLVGPHLDGTTSEYRGQLGVQATLRRRCRYACDEKNGPEYVFASRDGRPDEIIIWRRGVAQSVGQRVASRGPLIWRDVGGAGFEALEIDPDRASAGPDSREPLPE